MSANSAKAKEVISRARTKLLSSHPFYGYIACRLKLREITEFPDGSPLPTMATDGIHLFYNPDFTASLSKQQALGAIAHETEHVYLKHVPRGMDIVKDDRMWPIAQIAMDMAINPHLKDGGFELIEGAVFPEQKYWSDSFENHYKRLSKNVKNISVSLTGKDGSGKGSCAGSRPLKGANGQELTQAERAQIESDMQMTIMNAGSFAKAAGKLPADIERLLGEMRKPKVAWQDVLRRFMLAPAKNDYRMTPPNRRYIWQNLYLPTLRSETVGDVLLVIDGSGSTHHIFPQFISEFASILLDVRPEKLHVMVWDTECSWMQSYDSYNDETRDSLSKNRFGAGGGSVFTDTFEYFARETGVTPQIAIVLTDMEIYFPEEPDYPVLWVATEDIEGPFGETVRIEI
jgi:predicted metal-dependent peptidase